LKIWLRSKIDTVTPAVALVAAVSMVYVVPPIWIVASVGT
jgi:hypothetical protein